MKGVPLSPNEEALRQQQSVHEQRKQRLLEVRRREKENASMIRKEYQRKKQELHQRNIAEAQHDFQQQKERQLTDVYDGIRSSLLTIGTAHRHAMEEEEQQRGQVCTTSFIKTKGRGPDRHLDGKFVRLRSYTCLIR